jgi:hypothetical protein
MKCYECGAEATWKKEVRDKEVNLRTFYYCSKHGRDSRMKSKKFKFTVEITPQKKYLDKNITEKDVKEFLKDIFANKHLRSIIGICSCNYWKKVKVK